MSATTSVAASYRMLAFRFSRRLSFQDLVPLVFLTYLPLAALGFGLGAQECFLTLALNSLVAGTLVALNHYADRARWLSIVHDFFPVLLILVAYRESGLLVRPDLTCRWDRLFVTWDRRLFQSRYIQDVLAACFPWLQRYLELAYLLCYPLVPLGAATFYWAPGRRGSNEPAGTTHRWPLDDFWAAVLLATLFCYAIYAFFPLTPPRVLFHDVPGPPTEPLLRKWNFWLLDHYNAHACMFPSGHVAAVTAVALAVRRHAPRLGVLFMLLAASVAAATVYGRYHYAADALAGAMVGIVAFWFSQSLRRRR